MRNFLIIFFLSSIVFAQIKTSQLPIKTTADSNKYLIVLDTTDVTVSQRTQRIRWKNFINNIPTYSYTWNKEQNFTEDVTLDTLAIRSAGTDNLKLSQTVITSDHYLTSRVLTVVDTIPTFRYLRENNYVDTSSSPTWTGLHTWTQDSLRINTLWYDFPAARDSNSVLFDSLGNGVLVWRNVDLLFNVTTSAGGWTSSGTTPAKIYSDAGIKVHVRSAAGDTTGTALFNNYGTSYFTDNATFADTAQFNIGLLPDADDGAYLGSTTKSFSDLFLASGAVINFNNSNFTITHSANTLTLSNILAFGASAALYLPVADQAGNVGYLWRSTDILKYSNSAGDAKTILSDAMLTANDFNFAANVLSIDYTNGQAASAGAKGFLTSTDWSTFNGKLGTSLTSAYIFVGNGSNVATGVAVSGDATISNAGAIAVVDDSHNHTSTTISGLDAANDISSGTLADARLSSNVPLKDGTNIYTAGANYFKTGITYLRDASGDDGAFATSLTLDRTWTFPDADGTIALTSSNITGSAAKWTTARNLAGNSVDGSANVAFANKFIVQGTADAGLSGAQFLGALGTGLVKNTTTTGVLSIATAGTDYVALTSTNIYTAGGNYFKTAITFLRDADGDDGQFLTSLTLDRAWTFPDKDGTVAMTSDLSSYVALAGNNALSGNNTTTGSVMLDGEVESTPGGDGNQSVSGKNTLIFYMTDAYTITLTSPTDGQFLWVSNDKDSPASLVLTPVRNGANTSLTLLAGNSVTLRYRSSESTWYSTGQ